MKIQKKKKENMKIEKLNKNKYKNWKIKNKTNIKFEK